MYYDSGMSTGITSTTLARLLGIREDALRKRLSRGRFPRPKLNGRWDRETIADNRHLLPEGAFVPPHWHRPGSVKASFEGMHSVQVLGETAAALVAVIDGDRIGILYTYPDRVSDAVYRFLADHLGLTYVYEVTGQVTISDTPSLNGVDLVGRSLNTRALDLDADAWVRLSHLLGFPLPWWPPRLRDPRAMLSWTPGAPVVSVLPSTGLPRHLDMAARTILAATGSPVIERYLSHFERAAMAEEQLPDTRELVTAACPINADAEQPECPHAAEIASITAPRDPALATAARSLLHADARHGCSFILSTSTTDRFERALLDMPTSDDEAFDSSLLALALRRDDSMVFRRIDGSDAHIGCGDTDEVVVVPPTAIPGLGEPKLFELPGRRHPIVVDTEHRAWPFPVIDTLTAYQVGYLGTGPTGYAFAVARLLSDPRQPMHQIPSLVAVPDASGPITVTSQVARLTFSDSSIRGAAMTACEARARLRKAAEDAGTRES